MNQRFGPYQVGETIGRGTFAKVKIAVHETTKTKVALKIIPRKFMEQDERSRIKITREIKILKLLRHPNIMRLYDVVQTKHDIVIVVEYISGGELFDYISRKGHLDEATARFFFQQLVAAIAYCHRYRVTHRDLKPENIMLENTTKMLKVGDFGLSSITHDGRFFETSCGTPNYASPEVVSGRLYGGPETDVWSCGVVLYTMLVGALPFDDQHISVLFKKIQTADYTMPSSLSPEVQDMMRRMIVVDPLERATIEQIMQHPWLRPSFPPYLLSLHYGAILETMQFAKFHLVTDEMLDEEVVHLVAARFRMSPQRVASIVAAEEEKRPSLFNVTNEKSGEERTTRYPAAAFFEAFANVIDAKLWPTPLVVPPAEQALRDEEHDIFVSYLVLSQRKHSKRTPDSYNSKLNLSFSESANNYLLTQSLQGYGSLNANSLHQFQPGGNLSFGGPNAASFARASFNGTSSPNNSVAASTKNPAEQTFFSLPANATPSLNSHSASSPEEVVDTFIEGYNKLSEPFLPLYHHKSNGTLLGHVMRTLETPMPSRTLRNINVHLKKRGKEVTGGNAPLLMPENLGGEDSNENSISGKKKLLQPGAGENSAGGEEAKLRGIVTTAFEALYDVETVARFGNDFLRHAVLFITNDANRAMKYIYQALVAEGLMWKIIHPFYLSCVKHPSTKLQVKIYRDKPMHFLVDVRVSCQSGMGAFDCAIRLMDRLRLKAVQHNRQKARPAVFTSSASASVATAQRNASSNEEDSTLNRSGLRSVGGFPSTSSAAHSDPNVA